MERRLQQTAFMDSSPICRTESQSLSMPREDVRSSLVGRPKRQQLVTQDYLTSPSVSPEQRPLTTLDCVYCELAFVFPSFELVAESCDTEHDGVGLACRLGVCSVSAYSSTLFRILILSVSIRCFRPPAYPGFPQLAYPRPISPALPFTSGHARTGLRLYFKHNWQHTRIVGLFNESASQLSSSAPIVSTPLTSCCQGATATNGYSCIGVRERRYMHIGRPTITQAIMRGLFVRSVLGWLARKVQCGSCNANSRFCN